ncbi:MAG: 16S rRNA (uracil(1498)-N(3))-methyltransferase [Caldisericia bacterium]|nr:16S rRNA (uracil(1498)-N(3))-methyltransferase [Caldisericia bacterium]
MKVWNFFIPKNQLKFPTAKIKDGDFHHLQNVLRLIVGDKVSIVTTKQKFKGVIKEINKKEAIVELFELDEENKPLVNIHLIQGLPKAKKMDLIIEKGTEIGINEFHPIAMERSMKFSGGKELVKLERWKRIAQSSAKQSGSYRVPIIHPTSTENDIFRSIKKSKNVLIVPYENEKKTSLFTIFSNIDFKKIDNVWIIIGPEGGMTHSEINRFQKNGFIPVTLGKQILRTETAGFFTAGLTQYLIEYLY